MDKLKPCPFCGGSDIRYSIKIALHKRNEQRHRVAMFCWDCNCYGARTLVDTSGRNRYAVERDESLQQIAIEAWNRRASDVQ